MKKVDYTVTSKKSCPICGKKLKANLVNKKPEGSGLICYPCYAIANAPMKTARQIRRNPEKRSLKRKHIPLRTMHQ